MRILGTVEYLGTNYQGWAKQIDMPTIQGTLEKCLSQFFNMNINIYGSGRTDAGVHAKGQTFHFDVDKKVDLNRLRYSLNKMLPKDIHILSFQIVPDSFHARYNAIEKYYRYVISLGENNPFESKLSFCCLRKVDIHKFKQAVNLFVGEHNFQDFTSKEEDENNFVRNIYCINVKEENNKLIVDLKGNGFMRYMIRYIIGTCLEISYGKIGVNFIHLHLDSKTRNIISYKCPSEGLYLMGVKYKEVL